MDNMKTVAYRLDITRKDGSSYMTLHVAPERVRKANRNYLEEGYDVKLTALSELPKGVELDIA